MTIDFTIMEYNQDRRQYTIIGNIDAENSKQAKLKFAEENGWVPRPGIFLFAKPPLCR